jgi:hypothetical protein
MIIIIIFIFFLIALTDFQMNQYIAKHIYQDGKTFTYNEIQQKYPLIITNHKKPIYIFFHICTQGNNWNKILTSQLKCIISSGLYDKCTTIWYGCSCNMCVSLLKDYFAPYDKIKPLSNAMCNEVNSYENMTLNNMIIFCRELQFDANCLYIHTKGTSQKSKSQNAWRDYMMYWLVKEHEISLELLNRGFYTVGTLYNNSIVFGSIVFGRKHYSGNFFWVKSKYMKNLPIIYNISNRYEAESLIFKNYTPGKHACINKDIFISTYSGLYKYNIKIIPQPKENLEYIIV